MSGKYQPLRGKVRQGLCLCAYGPIVLWSYCPTAIWSYGPIPCLNDRLSPVNPIPYLLGGKRGVKDGYFRLKRLFCKLLIVRGKVRVCHRTETTILLLVCNRLFWLLNGCTYQLIRFLNGYRLA